MGSCSELNLYAPLTNSARQIRLLYILPGQFNNDLTCEMRVASLREPPTYEALSYVWGSTANEKPIIVNGHILHVTANLEQALRYLRKPEKSTVLWVDAVCINQVDHEEKMVQVNMMSIIYSKSVCGTVWLGDYHQNGLVTTQVREAFELVKALASQEHEPDTTWTRLNFRNMKPASNEALEQLMENPWWLRIWTVQEVIFPPEVVVRWGDQSILWHYLESITRMIAQFHRADDINVSLPRVFRGHRLSGPISAILLYRHNLDPSRLNLFWRFRYRFLGEDEKGRLNLTADYSMSPAAVYTRVSYGLFGTMGNLKPLIGRRGESQISENLPSWVVDWGRPQPTEPGVSYTSRYWDHANRYNWYCAHNGIGLFLDFNAISSTISLRGHLVDSINVVGDPVMQEETHRELSTPIIKNSIDDWERLWNTENKAEEQNHSGKTVGDAFWRTLTGNMMTRNGEPVRWLEKEDYLTFQRFRNSEHKETCSCEILDTLRSMLTNQAVFLTRKGYVGLGPPNLEHGDELWLIFGCNVPLLLRPVGKLKESDSLHYVLVGDSYVHGLMLGEYIRDLRFSEIGEVVTIH